MQSFYDGTFAPDLSSGMFSAWSPLTNDPNVAAVPNLYLRRDQLRREERGLRPADRFAIDVDGNACDSGMQRERDR